MPRAGRLWIITAQPSENVAHSDDFAAYGL
jgi:hypothetical protein